MACQLMSTEPPIKGGCARPGESVGGAQTHINLNQGLSFVPLGSDGLKES